MRTIDLRSDTVTHPTAEMREAMCRAEVGDDVYGEDPTVNKLEEMAAAMLGKEAGLFVCSGTMGNFLALLAHCGRGDEAIVGHESHIAVHEGGGMASLAGIHPRQLKNQSDGTLDLREIEESVNDVNDIHMAKSRLLCLENTWHGVPLSLQYMEQACAIFKSRGLATHLDGARVFNAAQALGVSAKEVAKSFDSVQFCFSKGLSAPMGSALCGSRELVAKARWWRKSVGGGMRQVGIAAAACVLSLESMIDRLSEDHANARLLSQGIAKLAGLELNPNVQTNMVFFKVTLPGVSNNDLLEQMSARGVLAFEEGKAGIRLVTHYGISADDVTYALGQIEDSLKTLSRQGARV